MKKPAAYNHDRSHYIQNFILNSELLSFSFCLFPFIFCLGHAFSSSTVSSFLTPSVMFTETSLFLNEILKSLDQYPLKSMNPPFAKPGVVVAKVDLSIANPNQAIANPDLSIVKPYLSIAKPNQAIAKPYLSIAKPYLSIAIPEDRLALYLRFLEYYFGSVPRHFCVIPNRNYFI